jgi:hypothetical protein
VKTSTGTICIAGSFGFAQDRLFDCASCDKAARGSAQDDSFVVMDQMLLKLLLYVDVARRFGS